MKKLSLVITLFILLAFCPILFPTTAHAADFSLGVYPPLLQIRATAPSVITKDITLVNASNNQIDVVLQFRIFQEAQNNNGTVSYATQQPYPDKALFQKVQLLDNGSPIGGVTLAPKQKKKLTLRIALPQDEQPADYYFSILFLSNNSLLQDRNNTQINAGIAINVLLSIGQSGSTNGILNEFSALNFIQAGPVPFTISVNNTSDHYIAPKGQILIRNMFGQLIGKVNLLSVNILQHSSRYIPSKGGENSNPPVALWNEKALFGLYQARLTIALSRQGPLFHRTIYFLAIPTNFLIGFFLAIVLITIVIAQVRRKIV